MHRSTAEFSRENPLTEQAQFDTAPHGDGGTILNRLETDVSADTGFVSVLERFGVSLAVTVHPGYIGCIGAAGGRLTASFTRCPVLFGIAFDNGQLALATHREITIFAMSTRLAPHYPARPAHYDAIFLPVGSYRTGECSVHDLMLDRRSAVFANTQFSCLSRCDGISSFVPLWQPPFISELMPQDRCHLNSFAQADGRIRYATAFAICDKQRGYRDMPPESGVLIDVEANTIVAQGLLKPHSVRLFDDELFVLNSAVGEVLRIDFAARRSHVLASLPGFTRGLRALDDVLLVGLSTLRVSGRTPGMPLTALQKQLVTGIAAINRVSGEVLGMLYLPDPIAEVLDFAVVPGVSRAYVQDPAGGDPHVGIEAPGGSYWMKAGQPPRA
jgi:uncharacterized protein (TIGR03032 family)